MTVLKTGTTFTPTYGAVLEATLSRTPALFSLHLTITFIQLSRISDGDGLGNCRKSSLQLTL